jgi:hypothetical protein
MKSLMSVLSWLSFFTVRASSLIRWKSTPTIIPTPILTDDEGFVDNLRATRIHDLFASPETSLPELAFRVHALERRLEVLEHGGYRASR